LIKHYNYNCRATDQDGQEHLVYANWLHNEGLDKWQGYCCDAGHTRFYIDKNFDVWSGECKNNYLGNVIQDWNIKTDTVCTQATCTGCTDDLITKKYHNVSSND
jgi:hypothetical protein